MQTRFPKYLFHDHSLESIRSRLNKRPKKNFVRDFIYGAIDGTVTTFAIVAGVKGAELSHVTIVILGISNVIADGFSMAASNYLGTKSEIDEQNMINDFENNEIASNPEGETNEVRHLFKQKGFTGDILEKAVEIITKDKKQWIKMMMAEEYGISISYKSPFNAALVTFIAFILFGFIPLLPFFFRLYNAFLITAVLTGFSFFLLGALKSIWSLESPWSSGLKTFFLGSSAAGLAYIVGNLLKDIKV